MYKIFLLPLAFFLLGSCSHMPVKPKPAASLLFQHELPDAPAYRRASELLSVINIGTKNTILSYLSSNADTSLHDMADFFVMVHRDTIKLRVETIEKADDANTAKLTILSEITGLPMDFNVTVDSNSPHLITAIHLNFAEPTLAEKKISPALARDELQVFVSKICKADMFSGAVLLAQGNEIIFQGACGEANKDFSVLNTVDTKFNLGSMNKMFTAIAIAQLMEQGKIALDDPLAKFLPEFPDKKSAQIIKIEHLLSHTSGLGNYFNDKYNATPKDQLKTIDDFLGLVKGQKPEFAPGTKWQYSNTGFLVLGKIIEVITGRSYFDFIDEDVYKPASMSHSGSFDLTKINRNLAVGYNKEYQDDEYDFTNNLFNHVVKGGPAGGGYSTVTDLWQFSIALQNGKLVKPQTLMQLTTAGSLNQRYGYGFDVQNSAIGSSFGHGGGFIGISSNLAIFPKSGFSAIVLSNYSMGSIIVAIKLRHVIARLAR